MFPKLNAYIWASIVLFLISVFITVFPVANYYFTKYIHFKHAIERGSYFIYAGFLPLAEEIPEGGRMYGYVLRIDAIDKNIFLLNLTLYRLEGSHINSDVKKYPIPFVADRIDLLFSEAVNVTYDESPLLRFIMSREISKEDAEEIWNLRSFDFLGFVKGYEYFKTSSFSREYVELDGWLLLTVAQGIELTDIAFIRQQFPLLNSLIEERIGLGASGIGGSLTLISGNTVPSKQDWTDAILFVFGFMVFPVPIILMAVALISLIIGIRKGL